MFRVRSSRTNGPRRALDNSIYWPANTDFMGVQLSIYIYQDLCKIGFGTAENEPSKILVTNNIEKSYYLFFAAQMIFLLLLSFLSRAGNLEEEFSAGVLEGAKLAAAGEGLAAEAGGENVVGRVPDRYLRPRRPMGGDQIKPHLSYLSLSGNFDQFQKLFCANVPKCVHISIIFHFLKIDKIVTLIVAKFRQSVIKMRITIAKDAELAEKYELKNQERTQNVWTNFG